MKRLLGISLFPGAGSATSPYTRTLRRYAYLAWFAFVVILTVLDARADSLEELLRTAAGEGDATAVEKYWDQGANINQQDAEGRSALMLASKGGHTLVVGALLERNADPLLKDTSNKAAMDYASNEAIKTRLARAIVLAAEKEKKEEARGDPNAALAVKELGEVVAKKTGLTSAEVKESNNRIIKSTLTIQAPNGRGSGFLFRDDEGLWLVSNTHVIAGGPDLSKLNVRDVNSKAIPLTGELKANLSGDVAMLRVAPDYKAEHFLTAANEVSVGDKLVVAGNTLGAGVIALMSGELSGMGSLHNVPIIETSAPFVQGCSGGPVVNTDGKAVAIATYIFLPTKTATAGTGIFTQPRRMAVRINQLQEAKPVELASLWLYHKATEDRQRLFQLYIDLTQAKTSTRPSAVPIQAYANLADKALSLERAYEGVRPSGMLDAYHDALESLEQMAKAMAIAKDIKDNAAKGKAPPTTKIGAASLIDSHKRFLEKLKFKKDTIFINEDSNLFIDRAIETALKTLTAS